MVIDGDESIALPSPPTTIYTGPVTQAQVAEQSGMSLKDNEKINGVVRRRTAVAGFTCGSDTYYLDVDLDRQHKRFTAVAGVLDRSPAATEATFDILVDLKPVWTQRGTFGQSFPVSIDVTGALRVRMQITSSASCLGSNTYSGYGDPAVE